MALVSEYLLNLMGRFTEHLHFEHEWDPDDATLVRFSVRLDAIRNSSSDG